jgi:hypothetical protein
VEQAHRHTRLAPVDRAGARLAAGGGAPGGAAISSKLIQPAGGPPGDVPAMITVGSVARVTGIPPPPATAGGGAGTAGASWLGRRRRRRRQQLLGGLGSGGGGARRLSWKADPDTRSAALGTWAPGPGDDALEA